MATSPIVLTTLEKTQISPVVSSKIAMATSPIVLTTLEKAHISPVVSSKIAMATSPIVLTTLEKTQISPPSSSPPVNSSLRLTFFDIPWLLIPPSQPLFFYNYSDSSSTSQFFISTILPRLKQSLSSALLHFTPFAGKLDVSRTGSSTPELVYSDGDSVRVTVAEAAGYGSEDFDHLCGDICQKESQVLRQLVPTCLESDCLAVQITCFPEAGGFSIGMAYPHVACDQRTFNNFLKAWAYSCKFGSGLCSEIQPKSNYDRNCIMGRSKLEPIILSQWWDRGGVWDMRMAVSSSETVRATFLMGPVDIEKGRNWIVAQCKKKNRPRPVLLSDYVVACGFLWACLAKAQYIPAHKRGGPVYFGFIAGGLSRLRYRVPENYFGNCVAFGRAEVETAQKLVGEGGIEVAAAAIAVAVKRLDGDVLGGAERWIGEWKEIIGSDLHVNVVGSPKVDLYGTDFGWGRPRKIEEVAIDGIKGVSLCESKDLKGGIEIGVALSKPKLDAFSKFFRKGLQEFALEANCS